MAAFKGIRSGTPTDNGPLTAPSVATDDWSVLSDDLAKSSPTDPVAATGVGPVEPVAVISPGPVNSASPRFSLASGSFSQSWTNTGQITANDDWSGVPSIVGYLGDDSTTTAADRDPRLITAAGSSGTLDVIANLAVTTSNAGGVGEFQITNPTIGLQGSGTADTPNIVLYLDATGRENIRFQANIRDIDNTVVSSVEENAVQQLNIQYRTSPTGVWINVPGGYFADVTALGATMVTAVDVTLPAGANNAAELEIRIMTTNATGSDEWVGIDDIVVSSAAVGAETQSVVFNPTSVTLAEGNAGATLYNFTVTRTGGTTGILDFSGTIAAGTTDAADYTGAAVPTTFSGSIAAGQASATVTVSVNGDLTIESSENFQLTLTSVTNQSAIPASIGAGATATGNITNDDFAGAISIADVAVLEGDGGTTPGAFTLTRTGGSIGAVSVDYLITLPGGAGGADSSDVSATLSGTVNFADGQTVATIPFTVNGDVTDEGNETFSVALSNPLGGVTITDGNAVATITNDDSPPALSIGDVALIEGNSGVTYMVFTVSLSKAAVGTVTVDYQTAPGSAADGSDYLGISGQVSIPAGQLSRTISVPIIGDTNPENAETLNVYLNNPVGAGMSDGAAVGTITNDDGAAYYPLSSGSFTQNWTNTGQITTDDDWSGVPYIIGYRGDDLTTATGTDARTITTTSSVIDVIANQTAPNTLASGGVAEFFDATNIPNATIALNGSGTADAPYIVLFMNAAGRSDVRIQANLRDIDGSADDAAQQINVQYRTSASGAWVNAPGGYFADVTTINSATQVTALDITLPSGANGAAALEIRIMTTNAVGNDEWVGIDDIIVSSVVGGPSLSIADAAVF
jgi:hypothetical protein